MPHFCAKKAMIMFLGLFFQSSSSVFAPLALNTFRISIGKIVLLEFLFYFLTYFTQWLLIDLLQLNRAGGIFTELAQIRMETFSSIWNYLPFFLIELL